MTAPLRHWFAIECADGEGRTVSGTALRYGDRGRFFGDRYSIAAGAFGDVAALNLTLTLHHARDRPIAASQGGGLVLADSPEALTFRAAIADCADGNDCLSLIRSGVLRGASIEFWPLKERLADDEVREVVKARLSGLSIVDRPAFGGSTIHAMAGASVNLRRGLVV